MNKKLQALVDQDILTLEEAIEYEELMICHRFFSMLNNIIDIGSEPEDIEPEPKISKGYYFDKSKGKYRVRFLVDGSFKSFGSYFTEQEAKDKVALVRKELGLWAIY